MKKQFRNIFCLMLAIILPLSFSACKSKKDPGNDGGNNSDGNNSAQVYSLTEEEVNRILTVSLDSCETFIENLNESNILKDSDYSGNIAMRTDSVFDYLFYPAQFAAVLDGEIETSKTYSYQNLQTGEKKYFETFVNNSNNKFFVNILIDAYAKSELTAYAYEFNVNNGALESLKLSYYFTDSSRLEFAETFVDFKNLECEIGMGDIVEFPTSRSFVENNFTKEKFDEIDPTLWGTTSYQKFKVGTQKNCYVNKKKMPNNTDLINQFDRFGFMDSYNKLDKYRAMQNTDLTDLGVDYFSQFFANGHILFDSVNIVFEIKTEE